MNWSTVIAMVSVAISLGVYLHQRHANGRAHFTADWESREDLVFVNHGPGPAKKVEVDLPHNFIDDQSSIHYIGAKQKTRLYVPQRMHGSPPGPLCLRWNDNRFRRQEVFIHVPARPTRSFGPAPIGDALEQAVRRIARQEAKSHLDDTFRGF